MTQYIHSFKKHTCIHTYMNTNKHTYIHYITYIHTHTYRTRVFVKSRNRISQIFNSWQSFSAAARITPTVIKEHRGASLSAILDGFQLCYLQPQMGRSGTPNPRSRLHAPHWKRGIVARGRFSGKEMRRTEAGRDGGADREVSMHPCHRIWGEEPPGALPRWNWWIPLSLFVKAPYSVSTLIAWGKNVSSNVTVW